MMKNWKKVIFSSSILLSSIFLLLVIPSEDYVADATRDDKPPGITMLFCGHNKTRKRC